MPEQDATIAQIRQALAKAIKDELGRGYQVNAYAKSDPKPPFAQIVAPTIDADKVFSGGADEYDFAIEVGVAGNIDEPAQKKADLFVEQHGDGSIRAALTKDRTLGGLVNSVVIQRIEPRQWLQPQSITGWEFTVRVFV